MLHRERAEAAQLDPVAARQRAGDLVEHDIDDALDVAMEEMRIGGGHLLNQLRLDHVFPTGRAPRAPGRLSPADL